MTFKTVLARHYRILVPLCAIGAIAGMVSILAVLSSLRVSVAPYCPRPPLWPAPNSCASGSRFSVEWISITLPLRAESFASVCILLVTPFSAALTAIYLREYLANRGKNEIVN